MAVKQNVGVRDSKFHNSLSIKVDDTYFRLMDAVVIRNKDTPEPEFPDADYVVKMTVWGFPTDSPKIGDACTSTTFQEVDLAEVDKQTGATFVAKCYAYLMSIDPLKGGTAV